MLIPSPMEVARRIAGWIDKPVTNQAQEEIDQHYLRLKAIGPFWVRKDISKPSHCTLLGPRKDGVAIIVREFNGNTPFTRASALAKNLNDIYLGVGDYAYLEDASSDATPELEIKIELESRMDAINDLSNGTIETREDNQQYRPARDHSNIRSTYQDRDSK